MSSTRAADLRRIAAEILKSPNPNNSLIWVKDNAICHITTGAIPQTLHVFNGDWRVVEQAPGHVTTSKQLRAWASERLAQLADEQEMEP